MPRVFGQYVGFFRAKAYRVPTRPTGVAHLHLTSEIDEHDPRLRHLDNQERRRLTLGDHLIIDQLPEPRARLWLTTRHVDRHYGELSATSNGEIHLHQLYVKPSERGRGLGGRLVESAIGLAAGLSYTSITAMVAEGNEASERLFHSVGGRSEKALLGLRLGPLTVRRVVDLHRPDVD